MGKNIDWDNYNQVKDRVKDFRTEHPEGRIVTEIYSDFVDDHGNRIVQFKAQIFFSGADQKDGLACSTGHSESIIDNEKVLEKGETVAIGRALATLGYRIDQSMSSTEEMEAWAERNGEELPQQDSQNSRGRNQGFNQNDSQQYDNQQYDPQYDSQHDGGQQETQHRGHPPPNQYRQQRPNSNQNTVARASYRRGFNSNNNNNNDKQRQSSLPNLRRN